MTRIILSESSARDAESKTDPEARRGCTICLSSSGSMEETSFEESEVNGICELKDEEAVWPS